MHAKRIALAFVLAGLAAPALAEKCSVCDFSDEPIVVKPTKQSSGGYKDDDLPAGLAAEPTTQEGTFFSKVVGAAKRMAERERERREQQQAPLTPLDAHGALAATPLPPDGGAGHGSLRIAKEWDAASTLPSKPKEIVVVGSKINDAKAPLLAAPATHAMKGATVPQNAPAAGSAIRR